MQAEQFSAKLYLADPSGVDPEGVISAFHGFIREDRLEEVMIDVADYSHVHDGPGVVLVCHEAHYYLHEGEGRRGLVYARKRGTVEGGVEAKAKDALTRVLRAARLLEDDPSLGHVRFVGGELRLSIGDRLHAPNDEATFAALRPAFGAVCAVLYDGRPVELTQEGEPRDPFTVRIRCADAPTVAQLLNRLTGH